MPPAEPESTFKVGKSNISRYTVNIYKHLRLELTSTKEEKIMQHVMFGVTVATVPSGSPLRCDLFCVSPALPPLLFGSFHAAAAPLYFSAKPPRKLILPNYSLFKLNSFCDPFVKFRAE